MGEGVPRGRSRHGNAAGVDPAGGRERRHQAADRQDGRGSHGVDDRVRRPENGGARQRRSLRLRAEEGLAKLRHDPRQGVRREGAGPTDRRRHLRAGAARAVPAPPRRGRRTPDRCPPARELHRARLRLSPAPRSVRVAVERWRPGAFSHRTQAGAARALDAGVRAPRTTAGRGQGG